MSTGVAARFPQAGLATPHYLASGAGAAELARGGNAIDAIVAANLALGVVAPYLCGYGGDLFAIVWDGELHGYLGSGRSPARRDIASGERAPRRRRRCSSARTRSRCRARSPDGSTCSSGGARDRSATSPATRSGTPATGSS